MTMPWPATAHPPSSGMSRQCPPPNRASVPDLGRAPGSQGRVGQGGAAGYCAAGLSAPSGTARSADPAVPLAGPTVPLAGPAAPLAGPAAPFADGGIPGGTLFAGKAPFAGTAPVTGRLDSGGPGATPGALGAPGVPG